MNSVNEQKMLKQSSNINSIVSIDVSRPHLQKAAASDNMQQALFQPKPLAIKILSGL